MARKIRKPFDVGGPFSVRRRFLINGEFTIPNEKFYHEGLDRRRLRQLYDNRMIDMATDQDIDRWKKKEIVHKRNPERNPDKDVEKRLAKAESVDWRSMQRLELIEHTREVTGILCKSKKEATETMEKWEAR